MKWLGPILVSKDSGNFYQNPYLHVANRAWEQMRKLLPELGLQGLGNTGFRPRSRKGGKAAGIILAGTGEVMQKCGAHDSRSGQVVRRQVFRKILGRVVVAVGPATELRGGHVEVGVGDERVVVFRSS